MTSPSSYQILGVSANASIDEIKRAYRAKAFLLHPDKNNDPNASQQFVELTEAYEWIIEQKTNTYKRYVSPFQQSAAAANAKREEAKRKAKEYAQMRYEEFEKTEAAQAINAINVILNHLLFLFACTLLVAVPFVLTHFYEFTGLILGLLFLLAIGRPIFGYIKQFFKPTQLWVALMSLVETYFFRFVILSVANLYLFLKIGLQTMLPLYVTILALLIPALFAYFVLYKKIASTQRWFNAACYAPLLVNGLFALNFWMSHHPRVEQYEIWNEISHTKSSQRQSTLIQLQDNAYENYVGIRLFADISQMQGYEHIVYQFEDGLLGIRVMKEYRFTP